MNQVMKSNIVKNLATEFEMDLQTEEVCSNTVMLSTYKAVKHKYIISSRERSSNFYFRFRKRVIWNVPIQKISSLIPTNGDYFLISIIKQYMIIQR
jgi:hypothetical protein